MESNDIIIALAISVIIFAAVYVLEMLQCKNCPMKKECKERMKAKKKLPCEDNNHNNSLAS